MKGNWDDLFTGTVSRRSFLERSSFGSMIVPILGASVLGAAEAEPQQKTLVYPPQDDKQKPKGRDLSNKKPSGGEDEDDVKFSPENIAAAAAWNALFTGAG